MSAAGRTGQERLRRQAQEIAAGLLEQLAIPAVREQQELLGDLAGDEWSADVTLPMLEIARRRGAAAGPNFDRFREKARTYLRANSDQVALQKLMRNRPLTQTDLDELERMLAETGLGDPEDLARARTEGDGLGAFVRSLVGLDRDAATDALSGFSAAGPSAPTSTTSSPRRRAPHG